LAVDLFTAAHFLDGFFEGGFHHPGVLEQLACLAFVSRACQKEQFRSDVLVAALLRFLVGDVEEVVEVAREMDFARRAALDLRQPVERLREARLEGARIAARLADEARDPVLLLEERQQQVLGLDCLVVAADREALGLGDGLLQPRGEFVETHRFDS
jgi:hypothetical protein